MNVSRSQLNVGTVSRNASWRQEVQTISSPQAPMSIGTARVPLMSNSTADR